MKYFSNKVVLTAGGSSGLGRTIAEAFVAEGAKVVIVGLEPEVVAEASRQMGCAGEVTGLTADFTRQEDVDRVFDEVMNRFGGLDVLVNAVGRTDRGKAIDTTPEQYLDLLNLNFLAMVRCTRAAMPQLLARRGHLVNIGSLAAKTAPRWLGAYPVSKFAVAAYSQQLRLELGPEGLHVLLVCPGPVSRKEERLYPLDGLEDLPQSARRPGGGARTRAIDPCRLARKVVLACEQRRPELVVPTKARLMFALAQLWPALGDRILLRNT